jgi:hypothetical protein
MDTEHYRYEYLHRSLVNDKFDKRIKFALTFKLSYLPGVPINIQSVLLISESSGKK